MNRKFLRFEVTFTVQTHGESFPVRMLTRERAFPRSEIDAVRIRTNERGEDVVLTKYTLTDKPHILTEQWEDFGCTIGKEIIVRPIDRTANSL